MRFLVEVNALGQTEAKRYGIEADTWQKALQETRKLRGEDGPISGFSIELLDDGCRAVDPMARLRYVVKKGDVPLGQLEDGRAMVTRPPVAPPSGPALTPKVPASKVPAVAPRAPSPAVPAAPPSAAAARPAPAPAAPAAPPSTAAAAVTPHPPSQRPPVPPAPPSRPAPVVPANRPSGAPAARVAPAPAPAPQAPHEPVAKVLSRREQAPTATMPLYYREESILVPASASELDVERTLRAHLASLDSDLAKRPRGKYVQIAAFDAPVVDKRTRPIAVLSWKDWKGAEPTFTYPRRNGPAPSHAPPPARMVPSDAPTISISPDALGAYAAQSVPPNPAPNLQPPTAPNAFPPPAAAFPSTTQVAAPPVAHAPLAPTPTVPTAMPQPTPAPMAAAPGAPPSAGGFRPAAGSSGSYSAVRRSSGDKRVAGEELIAQLFEEMHALHFLNDALEGGHFCLEVALAKLPSRAAYLHLYDIDKREFVIVCTRGQGTEVLLLSRSGESDALLASAMRKRRAIVVNDPAQEPGLSAPRFAPVGGAKRIIVTPVMQAGRFLGAIEIVNPIDGAPFTETEGNAISYMAEQYADFVAQRGVVLEPEKVSRASQNARA